MHSIKNNGIPDPRGRRGNGTRSKTKRPDFTWPAEEEAFLFRRRHCQKKMKK